MNESFFPGRFCPGHPGRVSGGSRNFSVVRQVPGPCPGQPSGHHLISRPLLRTVRGCFGKTGHPYHRTRNPGNRPEIAPDHEEPDPGKSKVKEEYADFPDGRLVRKRLTGMVFVFGEGDHLAMGGARLPT